MLTTMSKFYPYYRYIIIKNVSVTSYYKRNPFQTKQESDFALKSFISRQESRPEVGRKLPSLLITPIQRVPRYKLLLQEVLQHTPNKHKEYNLLQGNYNGRMRSFIL